MPVVPGDNPAGWYGTVTRFLDEPNDILAQSLTTFVSYLNLTVGSGQTRAWNESVRTVKREMTTLLLRHPEARDWGIVLEYELPRERGRRPDIVILTGCSLQLIEFKGRRNAEQADIDQLLAYARDLGEYHAGSRGLRINSVLSLDDAMIPVQKHENMWIVGGKHLASCLDSLADVPACEPPDIASWVDADYSPLPSLVSAARRIFDDEPLPHIRRASSAGIPEALQSLQAAATRASENNERHIALVTGVPGAGKTLVGLQFVYQTRFTQLEGERPAVFLSGNGPLVDVLQHALKSRVFVQDVHGFLVRYGGPDKVRLPEEHIWVYDEAQRAWDADRVKGKRGHDLSEHEDFVRLGMRMPKWAMLVGLIGQGQEIHLGEEGGLEQWNEAIEKSGGEWVIHCPARIAHLFPDKNVDIDDALDLSTTLRSHVAGEMHEWVNCLLSGQLDEASALARRIIGASYTLYVTRDLETARTYAKERYSTSIDSRYGLLGSSKAKHLAEYGLNTTFQATRAFRPGPWYNDPPTTLKSCCQLLEAATEFQCQGLELDFPIVGWDTDLLWGGLEWVSRGGRSTAKDPHKLRLNSYRVLLTRGRDGMAIFVPPTEELDATFAALIRAGCKPLQLGVALVSDEP